MARAHALLWLALATACASPPTADAPAVVAAAVEIAPALLRGDVHVYALQWRTEATRALANGSVGGGVALEGELAVSAVDHGPEGTRVAVWFEGLPVREISMQGQVIALDEAAFVGVRAELLIAADGEVRRAFFDPDSTPVFRELMTGVIARLDFRGATPETTTRRVRGGHGLVEVVYRADTDGAVSRQLARVLRFDTLPGATAPTDALVGSGRIELDEHRVPVRIELHDGATMTEPVGLLADDRFTAVRTRIERRDVVALAHTVEIDPTDATDRAAAAQALDRQLAAGLTMQDLQISMATMDGGVMPRPGELSRAAALLRGWPERADELIPLALGARGNGRQLAFDILAAAGTPQAQQAMRTLLADPAAAGWRERPLLLQRFAFVAAPTAATAEFLLELLAGAEHGGHDELRRATLHPLGTVLARTTDPWLGERMHAALLDAARDPDGAVRAAGLAGLGNAGRPGDLPRLLAALDDPEAVARIEAVASLRSRVVPEATAALLAALGDDDPDVASRALRVLRERHLAGALDRALVARAHAGEYNAGIERAMASTLVANRDDGAVAAALAAIAGRTEDPELARQLAVLARG